MSAGALCPDHPGPFNPQPNSDHPQSPAPSRVRRPVDHQPSHKCEAVHEWVGLNV